LNQETPKVKHVLTLVAIMSVLAAAAPAAAASFSDADISPLFNTSNMFTSADGLVTVTGSANFGGGGGFWGVAGGTNGGAVDDADGNPATTGDQESLAFQFNSTVGLSMISFTFTRANPIRISGFSSNPGATVTTDPGSSNITAAWDANNNSVTIFHPWHGGDISEVSFAAPGASAGQTLTLSVEDLGEAGPWAAIHSVTYDTVSTPVVAGDVDGDGDVDLVDYGVIRDAFYTSVTSKSMGDLTFDNFVDFDDFEEWKTHFPFPVVGDVFNLTVVPEPASVTLLCLGVALGLVSRRRKRNAR